MAGHDGSDVYGAFEPQHLSALGSSALGRTQPRSQSDLRGTDRGYRSSGAGRSRRALGREVSIDHPIVDQRLAEFIPFLDYDTEMRRVLFSTNEIESLNSRYRRAAKARGHFPTGATALKCLYLLTRSLDPTGKGQARLILRWKPALNAFAITFADRWPGSETYWWKTAETP